MKLLAGTQVRRRVVVTQPYVATYRVPLWNAVSKLLDVHDVELVVVAGDPSATQQRRNDASAGPWLHRTKQTNFTAMHREVNLRPYPPMNSMDLLVTEFSAANLTAWRGVLTRPSRTVLWGHGRSYVDDPTAAGTLAKAILAHRAAHIMTYTERGASYVVESMRIPRHRVTAIGNSTDTDEIIRGRQKLEPEATNQVRKELDCERSTAIFIGGLDASKRIDFLMDAAKEAFQSDPTFRLIVVGSGELTNLLDSGIRAGYVKHISRAVGSELALFASIARAVWMPGRVGLVAVDALALGLPVHTVKSRYHAPELDFLSEGETVFTLPEHPFRFATDSLSLMREPIASTSVSKIPSITTMAELFVSTTLGVMESSSSKHSRTTPLLGP